MDNHQQRRLMELLSALVEERLDAAGEQELQTLLEDEPARELYLQYFELHADLQLSAGEAVTSNVIPSEEFKASSSRVPGDMPSSSGWMWTAIAMAGLALVLLASLGGQFLFSTDATQSAILATITAGEDVRGTHGGNPLNVGSSLASGLLELHSGKSTLEMTSGAVLFVQGPARLELIDDKAVRLLSGDINVNAPDSAVGFRVLTPNADVVDLGTEFHVSVDEAGATEVHVSHGIVVARSNASDVVVPILHGEAGRIDNEQGDIVPLAFDPSRFGKLIDRLTKEGTDDDVSETLLSEGARVVFLGDRTCDRETHLLLINDALSHLPEDDRPKLFNAGVSFRLFFKDDEFNSCIIPFGATHAVLSFGPELAVNEGKFAVSPERFETGVTRLCDRLEQEEIEPMVMTGFPLQGRFTEHQPKLDRYNSFLRSLAEERGYLLIDVEQAFRNAVDRKLSVMASNHRWPTFEGHRQIALAVLTSWGYPEVEVAETLEPSPLPGFVPEWRYRFKDRDEKLNSDTVAGLEADESWKRLRLPMTHDKFAQRMADRSHSITYRDRARGFATNLYREGSGGIVAATTVNSESDRTAFLNTGASLHAAWLNGEKVYQSRGWSGWHAGKERIPIELKAGDNELVIEAGSSFFVGITDRFDWPLP